MLPVVRAILGDVADRNYQLIVEGELSDNLESAFHRMTLTRAEGNTVLNGNVRDQAELHGLLQRVSDLGLTLLEARAIDRSTASKEMDPPTQPGDEAPRRSGW